MLYLNYKTKELISQEEKSQEEVNYAVKSQKLQYQSNLLATERSLSEARNRLKIAKTEYPLDFEKIMDLLSDVESLQKGFNALKEIGKELGFE